MPNTLIQSLLDDFFSVKQGQLFIGEKSVKSVVDEIGTPAYIYDAEILRKRYQEVRGAFDSRVSILFALKSNSNAAFANVLREQGAGAEVASAGEIEIAKAAGFRGDQIQFAGPGKTNDDLERACKRGVFSVNVESAGEVERLSLIAERLNQEARVSIRVQQPSTLKGARMRMSGADSKFGVPIQDVPALAEQIERSPSLSFCGLHLYAGTQCFEPSSWIAMAQELFDLTELIESTTALTVQHLNFGGGFGVPVFEGDPSFDVQEAGRLLNDLIAKDTNPKRHYFIELGRYLAAPAGMYVMQVTDIKTSGEKQHVILNGGMHHHAAAVGLGSLVKRSFPIVLPERMLESADTSQCLGGPLCLPADEISAKVDLPKAERGDIVAVLVSGAYGLTFSPVMFLGHPLPAEAIVDKEKVTLVRQRGKPEDILRGQITPEMNEC